jgi:hypothetical protein
MNYKSLLPQAWAAGSSEVLSPPATSNGVTSLTVTIQTNNDCIKSQVVAFYAITISQSNNTAISFMHTASTKNTFGCQNIQDILAEYSEH